MFCENWRDIGGKVWVDKRVLLRHTGTYVFDYANQDNLYKQLHEMAQASQGTAAPVDTTPQQITMTSAAPEVAPVPEPVKAKKVIGSSKKAKKDSTAA